MNIIKTIFNKIFKKVLYNKKSEELHNNNSLPEMPADLSKIKIENITKHIEVFRGLIINSLILVLLILVIIIGVKELRSTTPIIEPVHIPKDIEAKGYTPEVISVQIKDLLLKMQEEALTSRKMQSVIYDTNQLDIEVPGTNISFKSIIHYLRNFLHIQEIRVNGEIVRSDTNDKDLVFYLRITGKENYQIPPVHGSDLKKLIFDASQEIMHSLNRVIYANHQYYVTGNKTKARLAMLNIISNPDPEKDEEAWGSYFNGIILKDQMHYDEAIANYNEAIKKDPGLIDAYNDLAMVYENMSIPYRQKEILENAIAKKHEFIALYINLAYALLVLDDFQGAMDNCIKACKLDSTFKYSYMCCGNALYLHGNKRMADEKFRQSIEFNPDTADEIYNAWGLSLLNINKFDDAINKFQQAIKINTKITAYKINLANVYSRNGNYIQSDQLLMQIYQKNLNSENYNQIGVIYYIRKKYPDAIKYFKEALKVVPDSSIYLINLAEALYKNNNKIEANKKYLKAVNKNGPYGNIHEMWGTMLINNNEPTPAIEEFKKAVNLDPGNPVYHSRLAKALDKNNQKTESINEYKAAVDCYPGNSSYHINLARAFSKNGQNDMAIDEFKAAICIDSKYGTAYNEFGNFYYKHDDYVNAVEQFRIAVKLDPEVAVYHLNLAYAYYKTGQMDNAISEYETAIDLDPEYETTYTELGNLYFSHKNF